MLTDASVGIGTATGDALVGDTPALTPYSTNAELRPQHHTAPPSSSAQTLAVPTESLRPDGPVAGDSFGLSQAVASTTPRGIALRAMVIIQENDRHSAADQSSAQLLQPRREIGL